MSLVYQSEKWIKEKMFGSQTCGPCILTHTKLLCRLPGVYVDPSLHAIMEQDDLQRASLEWAFGFAEGVIEVGAAGVHVMNFGMPPDLIDEFLTQIRDRPKEARGRAGLQFLATAV